METLTLELKVILTTIDDKILPDQPQLIDLFTDYLYKYYNNDGAIVQAVEVTAIDGERLG